MKNMQKKTAKFFEEFDDDHASLKEERRQRRAQKNWKREWMAYSHEAEDHEEFFK